MIDNLQFSLISRSLLFCPYFGSTTTKAANEIEVGGRGGGAAGDSYCMVSVRFGSVSQSIAVSVYTTSCDEFRLHVEKAFKEHVPASTPRLRLVVDGRDFPIGGQTLAELGFGLGKVEVVAELMANIDCGGKETQKFKSIPVENISLLIATIKVKFEAWRQKHNPVYEERFPGDPLAGKEVVFDGFSDSLKYFFEKTKMNPSEDFKQFYSDALRTIASSYVWSRTRLVDMAGRRKEEIY